MCATYSQNIYKPYIQIHTFSTNLVISAYHGAAVCVCVLMCTYKIRYQQNAAHPAGCMCHLLSFRKDAHTNTHTKTAQHSIYTPLPRERAGINK